MDVVVWVTEGTWEAAVDAARELSGAEFALLHVIDVNTVQAVAGARAGLLGRGLSYDVGGTAERVLADGQSELLAAARERLGRPARLVARQGRIEREVIAACAEAGLLVLARDGDHTRLGPHSIGHHARFVIDHAPCRVLLVWPDEPPDLSTVPPPPPH
ncbi:universal stress protein [Actinoplanes sp. KI2]|uniref:universal stress protein n=1 Tax=Actinoplanes sp. KI2 TaxID=2983315 RepID=UPI0021D5CB7D|nr:universal stress protein [Actinoplanes sp. KI2]MCU7727748.1 universal stress protein [Actinoplanes sp. KI2]